MIFRRKTIYEIDEETPLQRAFRLSVIPVLCFALLGLAIWLVPNGREMASSWKSDRILAESKRLAVEGDLQEALNRAWEAKSRRADHAPSLRHLAELVAPFDPVQAGKYWNELREFGDDLDLSEDEFFGFIRSLELESRWEDVAEITAMASARFPQSGVIRSFAARSFEREGDRHAASKVWDEAISLEPENARLKLGRAQFDLTSPDASVQRMAYETLWGIALKENDESVDALEAMALADPAIAIRDRDVLDRIISASNLTLPQILAITPTLLDRMGSGRGAVLDRLTRLDKEDEGFPSRTLLRWLNAEREFERVVEIIEVNELHENPIYIPDYFTALLVTGDTKKLTALGRLQESNLKPSQSEMLRLLVATRDGTAPRDDEFLAVWRLSQLEGSHAVAMALGVIANSSGNLEVAREIFEALRKQSGYEKIAEDRLAKLGTVSYLGRRYPEARLGGDQWEFFGVEVNDSYRWLSEPRTAETREWKAGQRDVLGRYFDEILGTDRKRDFVKNLLEVPFYDAPVAKGSRIYFRSGDLSTEVSQLLSIREIGEKPSLILSPAPLSNAHFAPSSDNNFLAHVSPDGLLKISDLRDGGGVVKSVRDVLPGTFAWLGERLIYQKQGKGIFMYRGGSEEEHLLLLAIGENGGNGENAEVISTPHEVADFPDCVVLANQHPDSQNSSISLLRLEAEESVVSEIVSPEPNRLAIVAIEGSTMFLLRHAEGAGGNGQLVVRDILAGPEGLETELISPEKSSLDWVQRTPEGFITARRSGNAHELGVASTRGRESHQIPFPRGQLATPLTPSDSSGNSLLGFSSLVQPPGIFRYDHTIETVAPYLGAEIQGLEPSEVVLELVPLADDQRPLVVSVTQPLGMARNGERPALVLCRPSESDSKSGKFSPLAACMLHSGAVVIEVSMPSQSDPERLISSLQELKSWITQRGIADASRIALAGNGVAPGLVAVIAPELFSVYLPDSTYLDLLASAGEGISSIGEFEALRATCPLQQIKPRNEYPPIMVSTVNDLGAFKFVAKLQAAQIGGSPGLLHLTSPDFGENLSSGELAQRNLVRRWSFLSTHLRLSRLLN